MQLPCPALSRVLLQRGLKQRADWSQMRADDDQNPLVNGHIMSTVWFQLNSHSLSTASKKIPVCWRDTTAGFENSEQTWTVVRRSSTQHGPCDFRLEIHGPTINSILSVKSARQGRVYPSRLLTKASGNSNKWQRC